MPSLYVVIEHDPGLDSPEFRELLEPWFGRAERRAGSSLMSFYGQDPADLFDWAELSGAAGAVWFEAGGGLEAVAALQRTLEGDGSARAERARVELAELRSALEAAEQKGLRFRLELDI